MSLRHALKGTVAARTRSLMATTPAPVLQAASYHPKQKLPADFGNAVEPLAKKQKLTSSLGHKFKLIRDLKVPKGFADVCGFVVKCIGAVYGGCDLYITDYTDNEQMRYYPPPEEETEQERDGDLFGYNGPPRRAWPGPYKFTVLKVNVKEPHANFALQELKEGDCAMLRNVKIRITPLGDWLEGDMWPDDTYPQKIQISKFANFQVPEWQAMLKRKERYWAEREALLTGKQPEANATKNQKKRAKKQRKEEEKRKLRKAQDAYNPESSPSSDEGSDTAAKSAPISKVTTNQYIRCTDQDISLSRIKDIIDPSNLKHTNRSPEGRKYIMPFINAKYRANVRVVDFEPKDLRDFAVRPVQDDSQAAPESTMDWTFASDSTPSWEWNFSLVLEDASVRPEHRSELDRLTVSVHHDQAQFLFGNRLGDPQDMCGSGGLLSQLRERLFILWGNLEEIQSAGEDAMEQELSNLPFECCLMEYGVEMDEDDPERGKRPEEAWKRMYSMFGATIL